MVNSRNRPSSKAAPSGRAPDLPAPPHLHVDDVTPVLELPQQTTADPHPPSRKRARDERQPCWVYALTPTDDDDGGVAWPSTFKDRLDDVKRSLGVLDFATFTRITSRCPLAWAQTTQAMSHAWGAAFFATSPPQRAVLRLDSNSANCRFAIYQPVARDRVPQADVFVKLAVPPAVPEGKPRKEAAEVDAMWQDAVVGAFVSAVARRGEADATLDMCMPAFMRFRAAFAMPIIGGSDMMRATGVNLSAVYADIIDQLRDGAGSECPDDLGRQPNTGFLGSSRQSQSSPPSQSSPTSSVMACAFDAVGSATAGVITTLSQCLRTASPRDVFDWLALLVFFRDLATFSSHTGFVHHDCHLGNLLYDDDARRFTVIDYGRAHIDFAAVFEQDTARANALLQATCMSLGMALTPAGVLDIHTFAELTGYRYPLLKELRTPAMCDIAALSFSTLRRLTRAQRLEWAPVIGVTDDAVTVPHYPPDAAMKLAATIISTGATPGRPDETLARLALAPGLVFMTMYLSVFAAGCSEEEKRTVTHAASGGGVTSYVSIPKSLVFARALHASGVFQRRALRVHAVDLEDRCRNGGGYHLLTECFGDATSKVKMPPAHPSWPSIFPEEDEDEDEQDDEGEAEEEDDALHTGGSQPPPSRRLTRPMTTGMPATWMRERGVMLRKLKADVSGHKDTPTRRMTAPMTADVYADWMRKRGVMLRELMAQVSGAPSPSPQEQQQQQQQQQQHRATTTPAQPRPTTNAARAAG